MYAEFFGLSAKPFSLLPDANFLFFSERHKRVVNWLEYSTTEQSGFMVITGDVGAGKTTVIRHFLKNIKPNVSIGVITNPSKTIGSLLGWIATAFEIEVSGADEVKIHEAFINFLLAQYAKGKSTILIIDEAQNMTVQMLEDLRMLSNVNNESDQLIQIIFVGQPELLETLKREDLRQFAQRVSVHCHLTSLTATETAAYVRHRLSVVRGKPELFDDIACAAVHYFSYGVPRLINLLCDHALMYSFAQEETSVTFDTITEVVMDRNSSGLNVFRTLPDNQADDQVLKDLETILQDIRAVELEKA